MNYTATDCIVIITYPRPEHYLFLSRRKNREVFNGVVSIYNKVVIRLGFWVIFLYISNVNAVIYMVCSVKWRIWCMYFETFTGYVYKKL